MRKTLTLVLAVALFGILAAVVVAQVGDDSAAGDRSATTDDGKRPGTDHAGAHETSTEEAPEPVRTETVEGDDISGPCDEAEHAGDPRCNGAVTGDGSDDDGHHSGRDDDGVDNSGPGSSSSGHGGGGDDDGGGGDDDSSGSGGGDDD